MRRILKNGQGKFRVSVQEMDGMSARVKLLEDAPFAKKGESTWVAKRFLHQ